MVDIEYSPDNYTSLKTSIRSIIRNLKKLRFTPNHLKTKKISKHAVRKLKFVIRYIPD